VCVCVCMCACVRACVCVCVCVFYSKIFYNLYFEFINTQETKKRMKEKVFRYSIQYSK